MHSDSSSIDSSISRLQPVTVGKNNSQTSELIDKLGLLVHTEGGYFAEIDRNPLIIPNPFLSSEDAPKDEALAGRTALVPRGGDDNIRNASTSIYYLLSPERPFGAFHRNKGRTVHTVIRGRGRYVLVHANESGEGGKKRVETFVVGKNVEDGERAVWIVEGGKFKASFLLEGEDGEGLLISETVIPGFEYSDHDFLTPEGLKELVTEEQEKELAWLLRKGPPPKEEELL